MTKVILVTNKIKKEEIKNIKYSKKDNQVTFECKGKVYSVPVEESIGSYIKVYEDDSLDIINKVAVCNNGFLKNEASHEE